MDIHIDKAQPDELDEVLSVLDESAAWLQEQGVEQWPERFSGRADWRIDRIRSYVESGETWLMRIDGAVVGTFTTGQADPDYVDGWPGGPSDALYIYRMAVRRCHAGKDLGGYMLDWSSARAAAQGYRWLRLDCNRDNEGLQAYHQAHGFTRVGTVITTITDDNGQPYTRKSGALFQREASTSDDPALNTQG